MQVYIFDKDSTIASTWHRRHLIPEDKAATGAWIPYSSACLDDEVIPGTVALMRALHAAGNTIMILTGATDAAREPTEAWLEANDIPHDYLVMRSEENDRHLRNAPFKIQRIRDFRAEHPDAEIVCMFDDYAPVVEAFAAEEDMPPVVCINPCYPLPEGTLAGMVLQ